MTTGARRLAEEIADLRRRLESLERSASADLRSIDGGTFTVYDDDGTVRQEIGLQDDGSVTTVDLNAPAPPAPASPSVEGGSGVLKVTSYGLRADGGDWPLDFVRLDVHVSLYADFIPSAGTRVAEFTTEGGAATLALDSGTYFVALVAVNTSGTASPKSAEVSGTVSAPATVGGVKTYHTAQAPTGLGSDDAGALWFDSGSGNLPKRWDGTAWVDLPVGGSAIEDGAISGEKLTVDALYGKVLEGGIVRGGVVEGGRFDGGEVSIATTATTFEEIEPFAGTALPAGWPATLTYGLAPDDPPGDWTVVDTGPAGQDGSALELPAYPDGSLAPAGEYHGYRYRADLPYGEATNFEVLVKTNPGPQPAGSGYQPEAWITVRTNMADPSDVYPDDCLMIPLGPYGNNSLDEDRLYFKSWFGGSISSEQVTIPGGSLWGRWNWTRVRVIGDRIWVRAWPDGDPEPVAWHGEFVMALDTDPGGVAIIGDQNRADDFPAHGDGILVDHVEVRSLQSGFTVTPDGSGSWPSVTDPIDLRLDGAEARLDTLEARDTKHFVGDPGEPSYAGSWQDTGKNDGTWFRRTPDGMALQVMFDATIPSSAGGTTIFTLPESHAPEVEVAKVPVWQNGTSLLAQVTFQPDGTVFYQHGGAGNNGASELIGFCTIAL